MSDAQSARWLLFESDSLVAIRSQLATVAQLIAYYAVFSVRSVRSMPKTPVQNIDLAKLALQQRRFTDCEQICTSILETDPREPNALFMLGLSASQLGDLAGTASAFARPSELLLTAWIY